MIPYVPNCGCLYDAGCNGGSSGSCPAYWCCIFILANSDFKTKTIDTVLFRYDVLLVALQPLRHRMPTLVTVGVLHMLTYFACKFSGRFIRNLSG